MSAPENNHNGLVHGGESAVKQIKNGITLTGPARDAENAVYAELAQPGGRVSLVIRNATRLQAAADLFWNAVQQAGESGDLEKLDHYIARFGWLAGCSLRAWSQVKQEQNSDNDGVIDAAMDAAREVR